MKSIAVFGVGSPFGEDNIAKIVIEKLKKKLQANGFESQVCVDYHDRPGLHLLECIKGFEVVHLIDAVLSHEPAGSFQCYEDISVFQQNHQSFSSHGFGVAEVLALGESLNCLPRRLMIHGVSVGNQDFPGVFSSTLLEASDRLTEEIFQGCEKLL